MFVCVWWWEIILPCLCIICLDILIYLQRLCFIISILTFTVYVKFSIPSNITQASCFVHINIYGNSCNDAIDIFPICVHYMCNTSKKRGRTSCCICSSHLTFSNSSLKTSLHLNKEDGISYCFVLMLLVLGICITFSRSLLKLEVAYLI